MNGRIRCPWHGACFSAQTGDIEDFPGMDSIHTFPVEVHADDVIVTAPASKLKDFKRVCVKGGRSSEDDRVFVIIGGGMTSFPLVN